MDAIPLDSMLPATGVRKGSSPNRVMVRTHGNCSAYGYTAEPRRLDQAQFLHPDPSTAVHDHHVIAAVQHEGIGAAACLGHMSPRSVRVGKRAQALLGVEYLEGDAFSSSPRSRRNCRAAMPAEVAAGYGRNARTVDGIHDAHGNACGSPKRVTNTYASSLMLGWGECEKGTTREHEHKCHSSPGKMKNGVEQLGAFFAGTGSEHSRGQNGVASLPSTEQRTKTTTAEQPFAAGITGKPWAASESAFAAHRQWPVGELSSDHHHHQRVTPSTPVVTPSRSESATAARAPIVAGGVAATAEAKAYGELFKARDTSSLNLISSSFPDRNDQKNYQKGMAVSRDIGSGRRMLL
ncbi:unnamed protein product [Amoebophrya sp. A25]|nr:unnamed protein product [Amoebophrya sp. A25]|eukprot:GSA25T00024516001.1